jgi:hypothetical protein
MAVKVSAEFVQNLGNKFIDWSQNIDKVYNEIWTTILHPGTSYDANHLKKEFKERRAKWTDGLKVLKETLYSSGNQLVYLGNSYKDNEDINTADAEKVKGIIDAVAARYKDAANVVPPPYGQPPADYNPNPGADK